METKNNAGEQGARQLFTVRGNWEKQSDALKVKYPKLSPEDVKFEQGKESELIHRLETKLGKDQNEIVDILKTNYAAVTKEA